MKGLETILATDTPHDAPAQLARLRRLWLPLLALLHEKPAAPPRQTATGVQGPTEEQSGGDISSRHVPLRPFHLDAYAQSSQFTSSIQFVMQAATLLHEPPGLHAAVGSLHALPAFHAHVLVQLVGKSLLRPHTAHCAVVGLKVGVIAMMNPDDHKCYHRCCHAAAVLGLTAGSQTVTNHASMQCLEFTVVKALAHVRSCRHRRNQPG